MERVETLLLKLQQQHKENLPAHKLLLTTQMLQHELMYLISRQKTAVEANSAVSISMPLQNIHTIPDSFLNNSMPLAEEKTVVILEVDEAEIAAELAEIKRNAADIENNSLHKPPLLYEAVIDDIPTMAHQQLQEQKREVNEWANKESRSVNDNLKDAKTELSAKLGEGPVKDLKRAIGINDRFLYINELFRGDEVMYERSIKTINGFVIYAEAEFWIKRELKIKLGWLENNHLVKQFDHLVKRRFS